MDSNHSGRLSYVPSQPAAIPSSCSMLSRDKRLPIDTWNTSGLHENVFGNQFSTIDSSWNHYQRIRHSTDTRRYTIGSSAYWYEELLSQEMKIKNRGAIPMLTFARRPSTISSLFPVDIP